MTTITIDRTLLVRMEKELFLARNYGGILRDEPLLNEVSAALSAPATAPEFPADWAQMIHYPECWDTAAYPELRYAIHEALAWSGCSVCKPATAPNDQLRKDAERYQWLAEYLVSDDESYDDAIVAATTVKEVDSVIDNAMKGTS